MAFAGSPARADDAAVAVIDLRAGGVDRDGARQRLGVELALQSGVRRLGGAAADALTGDAGDAGARAAAAAIAEAQEAFGALDCGRARPAAEDAVLLLAAAAAPRDGLATAWSYVLLCADRDGDGPMARAAADRLRALGGARGIPDDLWIKYPEIDAATDRDIVEITVAAAPGAAVEIDHVAGPARRFVSAGKHVVAVAGDGGRGAVFITVHGKPLTVEVPVSAPRDTWSTVAAQVAAWQTKPPTAAELAELMTSIGARFAVVLDDGAAPALWERGDAESRARRIDTGADGGQLGPALTARLSGGGAGPDPGVPLLTEADVPGPGRGGARADEPTRWWVYAVIGGALAAGAVTIYALDAGEDRQRIELTFP